MDEGGKAGVFLTLNDCRALYPRLKKIESSLSSEERKILFAIEKLLYGSLSIREMEELLAKSFAPQGPVKPGA